MKAPSMTRSRSVSFNVTSLIDIVFLLIIFFLVASHVARSEAVEPVDLPEVVDPSNDNEEAAQRIVLTVMADQSMWVGGRQVSLQQVEQLIQDSALETRNEIEVRIRADHAATYMDIEPILLACARFGVTKVGFAVLKKSK